MKDDSFTLLSTCLRELQPAQKVIIFSGNVAQFRVRLIVLKVRLDARRVFLQFLMRICHSFAMMR